MSNEGRSKVSLSLAIILGVTLLGAGYLVYQSLILNTGLKNKTAEQQQTADELASTTLALTEARDLIARLSTELEDTKKELEDTEDDLRKEEDRNEEFSDQIKKLTGTVHTLDKLSKTDEELLQKYSKVYFLNENYVPSDIKKIDNKYILEGKDTQYFHGDALSFLEDMMEEAADDGIDLKITSAYRSFDHQSALKGEYTTVYGSGANTFSADQGYSEHQLGTTVDLTTPAIGGTYESFAQTEAFEWLKDNAHRYGFTLSYPADNTFYVFEPWHWRFVGVDLARDLDRANANFYDWDQRKIDTYLISIFD